MPSGVKITDLVQGSGEEATHGKIVVVNLKMSLNRGDELQCLQNMRMDLGDRNQIAGLRYGIEGMRVGGQRTLVISPHLAYGMQGIPGQIPPNAVIRCEVELVEVRETKEMKPADFPPGRHLCVFRQGDLGQRISRWQFGLTEDGQCGLTITTPVVGLKWRYARMVAKQIDLDAGSVGSLFKEASLLSSHAQNQCGHAVEDEFRWLTIGVSERGQYLLYYTILESEPVWAQSKLAQVINGALGESAS